MEETTTTQVETKFCKECGGKILRKAVICPLCGCQVEETATATAAAPQQIVINNSNQNANVAAMPFGARLRDKWVALFLCFFLGFCGAHKFYEGKFGAGVVYMCTFGLFFWGWAFDFLTLLGKPNQYYVI